VFQLSQSKINFEDLIKEEHSQLVSNLEFNFLHGSTAGFLQALYDDPRNKEIDFSKFLSEYFAARITVEVITSRHLRKNFNKTSEIMLSLIDKGTFSRDHFSACLQKKQPDLSIRVLWGLHKLILVNFEY
jgi:hypothetical protein